MDLVVTRGPGAAGRDHRRGVVDIGTAVGLAGVVDAQRAGDDVGVGVARDVRQCVTQVQVGGPERRGRFRPYDQPGRCGSFVLRGRTLSACSEFNVCSKYSSDQTSDSSDGNVGLHQRRALVGRQSFRLDQLARVQHDGRAQRCRQQHLAPATEQGMPRQQRC